MEFWGLLWAGVLVASLALFAALAAWIGVGAFFDLRELLRGDRPEPGD
ncbi:MAG: hypothetical protein AAGK22_24200 [Acidobacteriota bacterium]